MKNRIFSIKYQKALIRELGPYILKTRQYWLKNAEKRISGLKLDNAEKNRIMNEYKRDYEKYRQTFQEYYYNYNFPVLTDRQKKDYLTMRDLQFVLRKYKLLYPEQWSITGNKVKTLETFSVFIKRKWMLVEKSTLPEDVQEFINKYDVIAKPIDGESGKGVYKIQRGGEHNLFGGKLPMLLEECVRNVDELSEFHPASLNTVRVTTISNGKKVEILGSFFRTGNNNSVYDNADSGGVFAEIDVKTGTIVSNGITEMGVEVESHPVTGKIFRGTIIPNWPEVIEFTKKIALFNSRMTIVAWDIAITRNGIELIECNSVPSIYPHQTPLHKGIRKKFYAQMRRLGLPYRDALLWGNILSKLSRLFCD